MRDTKIIKNYSSGLCPCLHHMVILRTRNKITDFFDDFSLGQSPFNVRATSLYLRLNLINGNGYGILYTANITSACLSQYLTNVITFIKNFYKRVLRVRQKKNVAQYQRL